MKTLIAALTVIAVSVATLVAGPASDEMKLLTTPSGGVTAEYLVEYNRRAAALREAMIERAEERARQREAERIRRMAEERERQRIDPVVRELRMIRYFGTGD